MPSWNKVLEEVKGYTVASPIDVIRRKYLKELYRKTGRNIIAYYSGFLDRPGSAGIDINDSDINSLMAVIHGLDRSKGLDLILHTPGGGIAATEALVNYLRKTFGLDVRAIVPQICMSAGTMLACSCSSIVMGKQSSIGPIDPQIGGIPAQGVIDEFEEAIKKVKEDPGSLPIWQTILLKYHPAFLGECRDAITVSQSMVREWLGENMFKDAGDPDGCAKKVVDTISDHHYSKMHAKHFGIDEAKSFGLKIEDLESDNDFQDKVLTVHHAYMLALNQNPIVKIVENQDGVAMVLQAGAR